MIPLNQCSINVQQIENATFNQVSTKNFLIRFCQTQADKMTSVTTKPTTYKWRGPLLRYVDYERRKKQQATTTLNELRGIIHLHLLVIHKQYDTYYIISQTMRVLRAIVFLTLCLVATGKHSCNVFPSQTELQ